MGGVRERYIGERHPFCWMPRAHRAALFFTAESKKNAWQRLISHASLPNVAPLSRGTVPPLDGRASPWWTALFGTFASLKGYQRYLREKGVVGLYGGYGEGGVSIWTSFKTSLHNVFPVDCELCSFFFLPVVLFRCSEVYSINGGAAVEDVAPTLTTSTAF